jgi:hypothetical protein
VKVLAMNTRRRIVAGLAFSAAVLAGGALVVGNPLAAGAAETSGTACVARTSDQLATYDRVAGDLVKAGQLTPSQEKLYRCRPDRALAGAPDRVTMIPAATGAGVDAGVDAAAAKKKCKTSGTLVEEYGTPTALVHRSTLHWCYNGKTVSDWSGICDADVTSWGTALGWVTNGCTRNDFVPYKLGGHNSGGVDHVTRATYTNLFAVYPAVNMTIYIWGHYNGTCDHRSGASGTIYHYC